MNLFKSRIPPADHAADSASVEATGTRFVDPAVLMRIKSLELRARTVVEGFWNGLHKSPYHGFSVEFTEYRQYSPGDDPRYLDWRLYARSDRYYVKRFEDETNLRCHLLLDNSKSMQFGSLGYNKAEYARTWAACLAWFLGRQRDAVGLVTFADGIEEFIPPRYRAGHLRRLLLMLENPPSSGETSLSHSIEQMAERLRRRGLLVLISDLLAPLDALEPSLALLRACGHEVVIFQVLDPAEKSLSIDKPSLFEDLETGRMIYVDPAAARADYSRRFQQHCDRIQTICDGLGISLRQLTTDAPLELALVEFLKSRVHEQALPARNQSRGGRATA